MIIEARNGEMTLLGFHPDVLAQCTNARMIGRLGIGVPGLMRLKPLGRSC
jgi:hypothetical protein